jgi:hypothetical protein
MIVGRKHDGAVPESEELCIICCPLVAIDMRPDQWPRLLFQANLLRFRAARLQVQRLNLRDFTRRDVAPNGAPAVENASKNKGAKTTAAPNAAPVCQERE